MLLIQLLKAAAGQPAMESTMDSEKPDQVVLVSDVPSVLVLAVIIMYSPTEYSLQTMQGCVLH